MGSCSVIFILACMLNKGSSAWVLEVTAMRSEIIRPHLLLWVLLLTLC